MKIEYTNGCMTWKKKTLIIIFYLYILAII